MSLSARAVWVSGVWLGSRGKGLARLSLMVMVLRFYIALHQSYDPFRALYTQIHTGAK